MSIDPYYDVRAFHSFVQETVHDLGPAPEQPLVKAAVAVVIKNPFAGQWVEDLSPLTGPSASIGTELGERALALLGGRPAESYGKGGIAGLAGEQEHVVACVTTVFGNALRDAVGGGKAWISSATKTAAAGTTIDIPLAYKDEVYVRSHYDAITVALPDAPRPDELVIIAAVATGGRVNARVGGMTVADVLAGTN
ncbi:amino acid synthesis family protein [Humibacter sp. BT305]|uniref:Peptide synthetase n=1 Tax=Cnuibacter physcomitrellae TaxID=1619308 RepID=A0A1X9LQG8_9MICO|nr:amino acid synthesis family protein [Cnuibacter physcomitrellae]ARJ04140.1 peptide synthetase [Cnuibacter physcomitrellae]AXH34137.1 amino acid synthesis family protein [Humibacter sp. BT305]MCS5497093.1 amino acid synthesis family protein [Cnuibacter physcomitrellae]GGI40352.1 peptide synthetase [Cnuibacter physcomitrellae]